MSYTRATQINLCMRVEKPLDQEVHINLMREAIAEFLAQDGGLPDKLSCQFIASNGVHIAMSVSDNNFKDGKFISPAQLDKELDAQLKASGATMPEAPSAG
jgi:hypothetical protein